MSSNLIFYCPTCKHTSAVPAEQVKPGPVLCGRCRFDGKRTEMRRDEIAEGVIL